MNAGELALTILDWALRALTIALAFGTLLSFVRRGEWWIRVWDFPRLQLGAFGLVLAAGLAVVGFVGGWSTSVAAFALVAAACGLWQLSHVIRYSSIHPKQTPRAASGDFRLLVSNLDYENDQKEETLEVFQDIAPDVLLLLEIDDAWRDALTSLRERYQHHVEKIAPEGLGMALWSNLPVHHPEVRFLVSERRPSIHLDLELPDGRRARFVGVHPAPPALPKPDRPTRYDSRIRDAELVKVARAAADERNRSWIVAGDFNDVAWSHTTRLFEEISGLCDPRVGRRLLNTYHAQRPLLRYPLDHVYLSPGFAIAEIRRVRAPGSDHFAVLTDIALEEPERQKPDADGGEQQEAAQVVQSGHSDAHRDDESA